MEELRKRLSSVVVRFRKGKPVMKVALLAVLVLCITALLILRGALLKTQAETEKLRAEAAALERENSAETEKLRAEAAALERENSKLVQYIDELGTVQGIMRIAQEKLGLVEPDTIIFNTEN